MKVNSKSFKIVSKFYVIYGDGIPIYVGYTNRSVKQRFKEHRHDKDFSDFSDVKSMELKDEKLSFDFTWDYEQTCKNANQVSLREGQLVQKYGTQDSVFQKADGGGQTWNVEKSFVRSNRDNPRLKGLSGLKIKKRLKEEKTVSVWLKNFVDDMKPIEEVWLGDFVYGMKPVEEVWLSSFVSSIKPVEEIWLSNFVSSMQPIEEAWLSHFVSHMQPVEEVWIHNFVSSMQPIEEAWLSSFVGNMKPAEEVWLKNFVDNMRPKKESKK